MERVAVFPGSFDPFTRGHEALVEEALRLFDRVVIGVGNNLQKSGLLTVDNRCLLIADRYASEPRVEVRTYSGLTGDFARQAEACAIVRGVRNTLDFEYERTLEAVNRRLFPELVTLLLYTPAEVADISSSTVRELRAYGRSVDDLMPQGIHLEEYL